MADGVNEKTYSAKQVATRIGTDAKQLRKFFRDPNSGYTAVGQGGRYDFPEAEIIKIKTAFDTWNSTKVRRNRQPSAEKKLATAAGLIPGQRRESPGTDAPPRTPRARRPEQLLKDGLHGNALDNDTLSERHAGIGARVKRHGLMPNQQGRLIPKPEHIVKAEEAKRIHNPYPPIHEIAGLDKPESKWLDFRDEAEIQAEQDAKSVAELFEPVVDPDDPDFELELEEDGDIPGTEIDFEDEDVEDF
jgi:hypothetical protein